LNSPLNIALDDRIAGLLAEVKIMIADSDRFLREHVEHWIEERLQAAAPMHQKVAKVKDERDPLAPYLRESKPARPVKVVEMACEYSTTPKSCSMPRGHQRSINLRYRTRPIKIATDEMVRDALEYCGIAV
ncbi:MAG: hypothetical protein IIB03_10085, partial [Acidobacteria bacterium]|nr:hypothetical protein [Acidobacteriota bacterium]